MEHIALEVFDREGTGSKFAVLPENTSITIRRTSQLFGSGALWTYDFRLNTAANAHIFGTAGEIHGSRLHEQIDKRKARLWAEGVPMYLGYLRLGDEAEVDNGGNVNVSFESGQKTFNDMIEGAKANQVPLMSDVMIGLALWRKRKTSVTVRLEASLVFDYKNVTEALVWKSDPKDVFYQTEPHEGTIGLDVPFTADGEAELQAVQEYPRMVFPRLREDTFDDLTGEGLQEFDCINTDYAYTEDGDGTPTHPYCNLALCYQKQGYDKKQKDGSLQTDYSSEPEAQRGYEYMPANRLNSAPNFYVIYWLRCLMKHLGIHIEENQMMDVEDLRRLFFVNTNCAYEEPETLRTTGIDSRFGKYQFRTGGNYGREIKRLVPEYFGKREGEDSYQYDRGENINKDESGFTCTGFRLDPGYVFPADMPAVKTIKIDIKSVERWSDSDRKQYERNNSYLHRAYATPECFPDAEISEAIKALENGFGIRLLFSDDYKRVRIVLLRNIFRNTAVQHIKCEIVEPEEKVENCIRGVRMTYGDNDDTHFHYKGFDDMLPHKKEMWMDNSDTHDYSKWKLDANYADIIKRVNAFDKTCYVTPATGNAYGIKIDKDAKRYEELHPSLFGYGEYMDAEDGDCTGEEETIETIEMGFMPAIMNDLNMEAERMGETEQRFALFVDETMRPRRPALKGDSTDYNDPDVEYPIYGSGGLYEDNQNAVAFQMRSDGIVKPGEFAVRSDMYARMDGYQLKSIVDAEDMIFVHHSFPITMNIDGHINEGYRLYLQDNYEPNDNGVSPVETHDWGLTLGIMRGSGDDAYVRYEGDPDDGEGNDTWNLVAGSSVTAHPDTCDNYGKEWDYDGMSQYSAADAEREIRTLCPATADNILSRRSASKQAARAAGWSADSDTVGYIYHRVDYRSANDGVIPIYCTAIKNNGAVFTRTELESYVKGLCDHYGWRWFLDKSKSGVDSFKVILAVMPSDWARIAALRAAYFGEGTMDGLDNGLGALDGRISLKLRAEKPNPYFDPKQEESSSNRRYLAITNEHLRQRGLCDQFYKEYSYWVRNARIWKGKVRMELAQLLTIDDTVRVTVGDVTGFIKEMEYSIDMQTGLGNVTLQIMYI